VLIIEDLPNISSQLKHDLTQMGISGDIQIAETIAAATQKMNVNKYDIVFIDWLLPDGTGYDILLKFKSSPMFAKTAFIVCTSVNDVQNVLKALTAGADEYIVKPWQLTELKKKIEPVLIAKSKS
jgi:two-component system, chemotaxis family, chemotaxis protein CheY